MKSLAQLLLSLLLGLLTALQSGTALAATEDASVRALLSDTRRLVVAYESEWFDDATEYEELIPILLESLCRVAPRLRRLALDELRTGSAHSPKRLYYASHRRITPDVELAIRKHRQYTLLRLAINAQHRCPFWIEPKTLFMARQSPANQFTLNFEGGGLAQLRLSDSAPLAGGGGSSRILGGYGFGEHWSLLLGAELGGGALLDGDKPEALHIVYIPAVPAVVRYRRDQWLFDVEAAAAFLLESDALRPSSGARLGLMLGRSVLRTQGFLPWAGLAVSVQHFFPDAGRDHITMIQGGLRIGFRWAP